MSTKVGISWEVFLQKWPLLHNNAVVREKCGADTARKFYSTSLALDNCYASVI